MRRIKTEFSLMSFYWKVIIALLENDCQISQADLAGKLDVTTKTVQRYLDELEEAEYIEVVQADKPFSYIINWERIFADAEILQLLGFYWKHAEIDEAAESFGRLG